MTNLSTKRPPLGLPKHSPVTAIHLCAINDYNGNPRRCYVVTDRRGRFVEAIDEGYRGEWALFSRWPWFNHRAVERLGLAGPLYPQRVDTTPGEYKRMLRRDGNPECAPLRDRASRYARRYDPFGQLRSS